MLKKFYLNGCKVYEIMLEAVRNKLTAIEQISLEQNSYNNEWKELSAMEDHLIRLIKIVRAR